MDEEDKKAGKTLDEGIKKTLDGESKEIGKTLEEKPSPDTIIASQALDVKDSPDLSTSQDLDIKDSPDYEALVERALLKRCMGYSYIETTSEMKEGRWLPSRRVEKDRAPDISAISYWLKCRGDRCWQGGGEIGETMKAGGVIILPSLAKLDMEKEAREPDEYGQ